MLEVGIVGAGTMGTVIAQAIDAGGAGGSLRCLADLIPGKAERLARSLRNPPAVTSITELAETVDLVVEAAHPSALDEIFPPVVTQGKDLLVLSVGGLIDNEDWIRRAQEAGSTIHCPSGAIAGLDAVKAAAIGTITEAHITSRKPPEGLDGAPYLKVHPVDLTALKGPRLVFEGSAREACRGFPRNVNVSAALSLAGIGVDRTTVRIIADPGIDRNVHEIELKGDFGRIWTMTENTPSENPKTSRLAALSALALLKNMSASLRIGT